MVNPFFTDGNIYFLDSPAVPPSATAHELFRGFSFVAPSVLEESRDKHRLFVSNRVPLPEYRVKIQDEYIFEEVCVLLCHTALYSDSEKIFILILLC